MYNSMIVDISAFLENLYIAFKLALNEKNREVIARTEKTTDNCVEKLRILTSSGYSNEIIPVLKCDAYGLGADEICNACLSVGIKIVSVVRMDEAMEIKDKGIEVLILNTVSYEALEDAIKNGFYLTVYTATQVRDIEDVASRLNMTAKVHLKINTGMNRFGADKEETGKLYAEIMDCKHIYLAAIFSHYHNACSADVTCTKKQFQSFRETLSVTGWTGNVHMANSACLIRHPQFNLGSSRPGIMLYGSYPEYEMFLKYNGLLKPVVEVKSVVLQVRAVKKGEYVGYGDEWRVEKDSFMALIPFGYGDGFHKNASTKYEICINGKAHTLFGNVSMDSFTIIFDDKNDVCIGDRVSIFGGSQPGTLSVDETAQEMGIISYELLSGINKRVKREYINL